MGSVLMLLQNEINASRGDRGPWKHSLTEFGWKKACLQRDWQQAWRGWKMRPGDETEKLDKPSITSWRTCVHVYVCWPRMCYPTTAR